MTRGGLFHRHAHRMPAVAHADGQVLSLCEGSTPLIPLVNIVKDLPLQVWVKFEGINPTASFKDRGMVVAIAEAKASGARCVICASTGNTSASAAAYAARANMACIVLVPSGKVASGKIAQAVAHGAHILQADGNFDDVMQVVKSLRGEGIVAVVNSINPMRIQGQKTIAYEVIEALGSPPDYHALPVGNAGNITAHWLGYSEAAGKDTAIYGCLDAVDDYTPEVLPEAAKRPIMVGFQAVRAAPFLHGGPVENPETVATAIRIGNPQSFKAANMAVVESGGWINTVTDEEILATQQLLASKEGVFCEPASAASVAGLLKEAKADKFAAGSRIVCTLTGHGLKDPDLFRPTINVVAVADMPQAIRQIAAQ